MMVKNVFLLVAMTITLTACMTDNNEPTEEDISTTLILELPGHIVIDSIEIEVSQNVGSEVEPIVNSRFKAEMSVTEALYKVVRHLDNRKVLEEVVPKGQILIAFGVANSKLEMDKWKVKFEKLSIKPRISGEPISNWLENEIVIKGSDEEEALIAQKTKKDKAADVEAKKRQKALAIERTKREEEQKKIETVRLKKLKSEQENKLHKINSLKNIMTQTWQGQYICETKTRMVLSLSSLGNSLIGTFSFYKKNQNSQTVEGVFEVAGSINEYGEFYLEPKNWVKRIPGYVRISLTGKLNENKLTISGEIKHPQCSSFEASPKT